MRTFNRLGYQNKYVAFVIFVLEMVQVESRMITILICIYQAGATEECNVNNDNWNQDKNWHFFK